MDKTLTSIAHPHDQFFREVMSDLRIAREFFTLHLPKKILSQIDLKTLELQPSSYFNKIHQESIMDLVYKVEIQGVSNSLYLIVEHQSTPDKWMSLRMLRYTTYIIERHFKNNCKKSIPLVHGIVIYHGNQPYPYPTDIVDLIDAPREMIPEDFLKSFQLIDLNQIDDELLKKRASVGVMEYFLKHIFARDFLPFIQQIIDTLSELDKFGYRNFVSSVLQYALERGEIEDEALFFKLIDSRISTDIGEQVMTLGERLINRGLEQGRYEGKLEGKLEIAKQLLAEGEETAFVLKITGLSQEQITALETDEEQSM